MFNIQKYLEKFSKNIDSVENYKKNILEIIENNTQLKLEVGDIEIKDYILLIKGSPALKNKIFIYKNNLLSQLEKAIPLKIIDIK